MKKILFILVFVSITGFFKAQDQLFKKDNTKLLVKITEISPEEVKYKLQNNLTGPTYVVSKTEVSLIIYENGQHEVINIAPAPLPAAAFPYQPATRPTPYAGMTRPDSLKYYKYSESVSMIFFSFLNTEISLIYQKDFLKSNFNIIIPVAIGLDKPSVTQSVYFNNSGARLNLDRKLFEVGLGINYYPSLKFPVNYYIGPTFRYMQYGYTQSYTYRDPRNNFYNPITIEKTGTLSRYCVTITNGLIFRTKSRIMINMFASVGFKNDIADTKIIDPITNVEVKAVNDAFNVYVWTGFAVGFCF